MVRDIVYALRGFRNSPTFTAVAVASLALGIGLNAAIFNLVSAVLLQPLPVYEPARLFSVFTLDRNIPGILYCSYPNYQDYRDRNAVFSGLLLYTAIQATLTGERDPEELIGQIVTGNYFDVLGVKAAAGRTFLPDEDRVPGAQAVVVISHAFWMRRYGGSPAALGSAIGLNNRRYTIVGVAPRNFRGPNALVNTDFWVPFMMYQQVFPMADWVAQRKALLFSVIGRLRDGVSPRQAADNMRTLAAQLAREYPNDDRDRTAKLLPVTESMIQPDSRGGFELVGGVALAASGLVLLIACANVGSLWLVRAAGRRKEVALRLALGVGRVRLIRQLLTESAILSLAGAAAALLLGRWARDLLWTFRPPWMLSGDAALSLDARVLAFTLLLALIATMVFGLAPAFSTAGANLATELRERRSPWTTAGHRVNLRTVLVMIQVALSVVALTGAGLFLRSLHNALAVDPGFDAAHILSMGVDMKDKNFNPAAAQAFSKRLLDRVRSLPGVAAATLAENPPFQVYRARTVSTDGQAGGKGTLVLTDTVEPGYFQAVRTPLLRGRDFAGSDAATTPRVAIINEEAARQLFKDKNPIGAQLHFAEDVPAEIVGVARDSVYMNLQDPPKLMVYASLRQKFLPAVTLWVRTSGRPASLLTTLRREVQNLDPGILLSDLETAPQAIQESLWQPRLGAVLFGAFGALAGVLTVIGIYGVISYSVGQRTRELGIRMALGAQPHDVWRQVLAEGVILVLMGLMLGLLMTVTLTGILNSLLFGVTAHDPLILLSVAAILMATALAACVIPAVRATHIAPMIALREE
ncbi:MAG TPA: ABC transporter permease [Bryobacteraceae bacterium]|nr:ABC transporter permease [Bryobacteraceae bacterium]